MKACRICGDAFDPFRSMQVVCSVKCAAKVPKLARKTARLDRQRTRARIDELRPTGFWMKQAQAAFNAWVRVRDAHLPCISCGDALLTRGKAFRPDLYHAGHYLTTGARPELRFDPANVHKQCAQCNLHLHGNTAAFRIGLVERIGRSAVARLEGPHPPKHYSADDLKAIRDDYRARAKALLAQHERQENRSHGR